MTPPARIVAALWVFCFLGVAVRGWVADRVYPLTGGDPLYSYTYRAVLIRAGKWDGVELMWHPPGYPLLLAGAAAAAGGLLTPYQAGVAVSLVCYVGLFWVVDRLVARRARHAGTRLVAGAFVALYETLVVWAAGPLTEPVYLLLLYGAVAVLDRDRPGVRAGLAAGVLLGAGFTVRLEAAAPAAGLGAYLALTRPRAAVGVAVGWAAAAGWLAVRLDYLRACAAGQVPGYTIPPAADPAGVLRRAAECAYHASTVWLPFALLLPYWVAAGAGLAHRPARHALLLAVVVPSVVAVGWTIMHKRTASFLLPAAAVWAALGVEVLSRRAAPRAVGWGLAAGVAVTAAQAGRMALRPPDGERSREAPAFVAAAVLADAAEGPVWAFGSEPDVYALRGWPVVYPFFALPRDYNPAYTDHAGDPAGFVAELRRRGFRYLTFALAPEPGAGPGEPQPFSGVAPTPARADLERVVADPAALGLDLVDARPADGGRTRVFVYRVRGEGG